MSFGKQENDKDDRGLRVAILPLLETLARFWSAVVMRTSTERAGGTRSERRCGNRDRNFAMTWFTMEALPGMMDNSPAAPKLVVDDTFEGKCEGDLPFTV